MSRLLQSSLVLALVAAPALGEEPKPNTLTPQELSEGWLLLFDGESTYGWTATGEKDHEPELAAKDGALVVRGKGPSKVPVPSLKCTTPWYCFELSGEYQTSGESRLIVESPDGLHGTASLLAMSPRKWTTFKIQVGPKEIVLSTGSESIKPGIGVLGKEKRAVVGFALPSGEVGEIRLRNLKLKPTDTRSLFNGKNLDGWSINKADPKRMASKWEVTKDGELSLKNGGGDLVSDQQFDNFVLQVECKTLHEANNSGVFFRCVPGQYQNGYEAQIQNSYKPDDRTKPLDYGTGAIYRRIPARKVVSNDKEWFTMTVAADGKHIATWVNGYQTVDWVDTRPANDNPRNGYRASRGPISLQGHDPTTDLLFRNFRIAVCPEEK